jgi:hypothetical protein
MIPKIIAKKPRGTRIGIKIPAFITVIFYFLRLSSGISDYHSFGEVTAFSKKITDLVTLCCNHRGLSVVIL